MSGEGPESIPTSADPRSKRPTKKRALSPASLQAASLDALFARPDQEIKIPASSALGSAAAAAARRAPPPEIVSNVQGSSAGAGSGEFHVYKAARRREYERLRAMDAEVRRERELADFEAARREREARDAERTRRNREKRERKAHKDKMRSRTKASAGANNGGHDGGGDGGDGGAGGERKMGGSAGAARELRMRDDSGDESGGVGQGRMLPPPARGDAAPSAVQESGLVIHDDD